MLYLLHWIMLAILFLGVLRHPHIDLYCWLVLVMTPDLSQLSSWRDCLSLTYTTWWPSISFVWHCCWGQCEQAKVIWWRNIYYHNEFWNIAIKLWKCMIKTELYFLANVAFSTENRIYTSCIVCCLLYWWYFVMLNVFRRFRLMFNEQAGFFFGSGEKSPYSVIQSWLGMDFCG